MSNPPAGSSEFLATLLTGPNNSCPHSDKTKSRHLPLRLGFSRHTDGGITDVDTSKLCQSCYDAAVPTGFDVWSTYYKAGVRPMDPAHKAHLNQTMISNQEWATYYGPNATRPPPTNTGWQAVPVPGKGDYYPPMSQAGLEDDHDAEVRSDIRMPVNAEAREAFRYIREGGQPFYIDQLHLTKPWDPNAPDQAAEDRRVARENVLAYQGARRGIVGTGVGGGGVNSIVEQRILGDRKEEIPGRFGSSGMLLREDDYSTPGPPSGGTTGAQVWCFSLCCFLSLSFDNGICLALEVCVMLSMKYANGMSLVTGIPYHVARELYNALERQHQ